jgi:hypothetical protein
MKWVMIALLPSITIYLSSIFARLVVEKKCLGLEYVWRAPLFGGVIIAVSGYLMTAEMCGPSFFLYMTDDVRCAATDTPAEVLFGTTLLAAVIVTPIVTIFALGRIFTRAS